MGRLITLRVSRFLRDLLIFAVEGTALGHALRGGLFVSFPNLYGVLRITVFTPICCVRFGFAVELAVLARSPHPHLFEGTKGRQRSYMLDPWTTAGFQSLCYAVCPRSQLARRVGLSRCCMDPHFYRLPHLESHGLQKEEHQCKLPSLVTVHLQKAQFAGLGPGPFFGRLERFLEL